jgi:hypothetical protein
MNKAAMDSTQLQIRKIFALIGKTKWEITCLFSDPDYINHYDQIRILHNRLDELKQLLARVIPE